MAAGAAAPLPPVKSVVVFRNGDPFDSGRRFVVNQRQVATMEAFLTEVTHGIGAPLAVRTLFTPRRGHRVPELRDLQTGAQYVAAGFERFKKLDYLNTNMRKHPAAREETQARVPQRPNVSAKWRKFVPLPCILHVFRNGDLLCPPFRFIIPRSLQPDLEKILSLVTEKVSLRTGAVRRLCSLEGATVSSALELETGRCYVAVGTERFKKLPYVELLLSKATERYNPGKRRLFVRNENRDARSGPEDQFSDSALLNSPESDGRRVKSTGDEAAAPSGAQQRSKRGGGGGGGGADEISAFFARPVKIRTNKGGQPRPPPGNGSVQPSAFRRAGRRRREEARGAEEVQEDENTRTELPVDQRAAETVEEEPDGRNTQQRRSQVMENALPGGSDRNGKQPPSSEQEAATQRTEESAAGCLEPEPKQTSLKSRPSSSASQPQTGEDEASPQPSSMKCVFDCFFCVCFLQRLNLF
ncbi:doublecortin domain-containing protein 2B isoform X2 [Pseudoliparis swirei]|uniref:doublecortin domain-containing protein 2B isoform X2 n=1 Tax=Pseudoliparis swirei TaxID=2059687 RepID=UPI0024BDF426|nr:doublecortin domain-containing protein 2B isoform X2 [Pseudoliparis swirei]